MDGRTDGRTDRQTDGQICCINIARQYADARKKSSDFDKIWYTALDIETDDSHVKKIEILKIQDGGVGHLKNRFFGHNSSTNCLISVKFCMRKQHGMLTMAT